MSMLDDLLPAPRTCCSDLDLDRLALGELSDDDARRLRKHLEESAACAALFAKIHHAPLLERPFPKATAPAARRRIWPGIGAASALVATAAILLVVRPNDDGDVRTKGEAAMLEVIALRGNEEVPLPDGASTGAGERVRFILRLDEGATVAVLSRDATGSVTTFSHPLALAPGKHALPGVVTLDATAGEEGITAIACATDRTVDEMRAMLTTSTFAEGCRASTVRLVKP